MNIAYAVLAWGLALTLAGHAVIGGVLVALIIGGSVLAAESR